MPSLILTIDHRQLIIADDPDRRHQPRAAGLSNKRGIYCPQMIWRSSSLLFMTAIFPADKSGARKPSGYSGISHADRLTPPSATSRFINRAQNYKLFSPDTSRAEELTLHPAVSL